MSDRDKFLDAFIQESFGIPNAADTLRKNGTEGLRAALDSAGVQAKQAGDVPNDVVKESRDKALSQVSGLVLEMVAAQNDQEDRIAKMATEIQGYKETNATLLATVKELRDLVAAGPQKPSQSSATVLNNEERKAVENLEVNKQVELESQRWGVPMKAGG